MYCRQKKKVERSGHLEDIGIDGSIILKSILQKYDGRGGGILVDWFL
jgi:hypothetical protein